VRGYLLRRGVSRVAGFLGGEPSGLVGKNTSLLRTNGEIMKSCLSFGGVEEEKFLGVGIHPKLRKVHRSELKRRKAGMRQLEML